MQVGGFPLQGRTANPLAPTDSKPSTQKVGGFSYQCHAEPFDCHSEPFGKVSTSSTRRLRINSAKNLHCIARDPSVATTPPKCGGANAPSPVPAHGAGRVT